MLTIDDIYKFKELKDTILSQFNLDETSGVNFNIRSGISRMYYMTQEELDLEYQNNPSNRPRGITGCIGSTGCMGWTPGVGAVYPILTDEEKEELRFKREKEESERKERERKEFKTSGYLHIQCKVSSEFNDDVKDYIQSNNIYTKENNFSSQNYGHFTIFENFNHKIDNGITCIDTRIKLGDNTIITPESYDKKPCFNDVLNSIQAYNPSFTEKDLIKHDIDRINNSCRPCGYDSYSDDDDDYDGDNDTTFIENYKPSTRVVEPIYDESNKILNIFITYSDFESNRDHVMNLLKKCQRIKLN